MSTDVSSAENEGGTAVRTARVPKYYRLKKHLLDMTETAPPGTAVPPERTLAAEFDTSRTTVRQALQELVVEGRLGTASLPAGVERMPMPLFLMLTALGSLVWNSALVLAGYWLGEQWDEVGAYVGVLSKGVLVVSLLAVAGYVAVRVRAGRGAARHRRV